MATFKEATSYIITKQKATDKAARRLKGIKVRLDSLEDDDWMYEELSQEEWKQRAKKKKINKDDMPIFEQLTKRKTQTV